MGSAFFMCSNGSPENVLNLALEKNRSKDLPAIYGKNKGLTPASQWISLV
jgi:hypothetical protein